MVKRKRPVKPDPAKEQAKRTNLEDYEDSVFKQAVHFRLQRYATSSMQHDRMIVHEFPEALKIAREEIEKGCRVLIYAVTKLGQFIILTPNRWDDYSKLWEAEHGVPKHEA